MEHDYFIDGTENTQIADFAVVERFSISQDGNLILFSNYAGAIFLFDLQDSTLTQLTSIYNAMIAYSPVFSPDESKIAFVLRHSPNYPPGSTPPYFFKIMTINIDGTEETTVIELPFEEYIIDTYVTWSPDGSKLAFNYGGGMDGKQESHIFIINLDGTELTQITSSQGPIWDGAPSWVE